MLLGCSKFSPTQVTQIEASSAGEPTPHPALPPQPAPTPAPTPAPAPTPQPPPNPTPAPTPAPVNLNSLPVNTWIQVQPQYAGATGGQIFPMGWNNKGVFDPSSQSVMIYDRWYDSVRRDTIYANALLSYNPGTNIVNVVKISNWKKEYTPSGGYVTAQMDENSSEPTPVDRHPLGSFALVPETHSVYLSNGLNQSIRGSIGIPPRDTWQFNLNSSRWSLVSDPTSSPPLDTGCPSVMTYDPAVKKIASFHQNGSNGTQTYLLDSLTNVWSQVPQDATSIPVNVSASGIAYDSKRNLVLTFGGGTAYDKASSSLRTYSTSQNKWTSLADAPRTANAPGFDYDSKNDIYLALVSSLDVAIEPVTLIYKPQTNTWSEIPMNANGITGTQWHSVTYDPVHDVFVYQGGTWNEPKWFLFRYSP